MGLEGEQVVVREGEEELERVPLPQLDQILVHGNLQLTTPLIRACLELQVSIAKLSGAVHVPALGHRVEEITGPRLGGMQR